ncbi:MAG: sodC [Solimicrobium sp.]|nr:sodC [Solimicrobium sp.]
MNRKMNCILKLSSVVLIAMVSSFSFAGANIVMNKIDAEGKITPIGNVSLVTSPWGVLITPDLKNLPAGMHGFHFHEKPDCGNTTANGVVTVAGAAGGHWDPEKTGKHHGPFGHGHLGDLPGLYVAADGTATTPVLAPRIKNLSRVHRLALMVHVGDDNFNDHPVKLGGGGARIACGVVD